MIRIISLVIALMTVSSCMTNNQAENPVIWADVPDPSVLRVGDTYYMSSTTMHMSPGVPIMKSKDLVNWELVNYAYDTLADNEALRLEDGENAYGSGSWASSLRYHEGLFYLSTFSSTTGKTHIFTTDDIEQGEWRAISFEPMLHDNSLFFDEGRVYMVYGSGDIRLVELKSDLTGIKPDGINKVIVPNAGAVASGDIMLPAEGAHMHKINGRYYLTTITWPQDGMRTALVHRAEKLTGPYEGKVALQHEGIAQGGLVETPAGGWYAFLFGDRGAVGRIPYLVPVTWKNGWPQFGVESDSVADDKRVVPDVLDIKVRPTNASGIVASDEFDGSHLPLAWQWNHNPDNAHWSLTDRPGHLRLTNGRRDKSVLQTRNTLTQRTFGPTSSATTELDTVGLHNGDTAGLILLQENYGFVGVRKIEGEPFIVMATGSSEGETVTEKIPLNQDRVYLKAHGDFHEQKDEANFYYSLDGESWTRIGDTLTMKYTLPHFMGYRFGLFNYATQTKGGFADFNFLRLTEE